MSSLRTPVGPQPPQVYWRRRLIVLLGLVAVITIIVLIVWNGGRSGEEARETPAPSGSPSATAEVDEEPTATGECNPAVVKLEAVTDSNSYAAGQNPAFTLRVTNTGSVACTFVVAADQLVFSVVSGADPIWTSAHCLATPAFEVELAPNAPLGNDPIVWDRTRSDPATCDTAREPVTAGGATYRLSVAIGDLTSPEEGTPFLLN